MIGRLPKVDRFHVDMQLDGLGPVTSLLSAIWIDYGIVTIMQLSTQALSLTNNTNDIV